MNGPGEIQASGSAPVSSPPNFLVPWYGDAPPDYTERQWKDSMERALERARPSIFETANRALESHKETLQAKNIGKTQEEWEECRSGILNDVTKNAVKDGAMRANAIADDAKWASISDRTLQEYLEALDDRADILSRMNRRRSGGGQGK